jgi:hypothetical protein
LKGGEKMKTNRKMILGAMLILAMLSSSAALMPVSAKNLNFPPGADRVDYITAGGTVDIALTAPLPTNYPPSATIMQLKFMHTEMPNADLSFDAVIVFFYMKLTGAQDYTWQPFAVITDNQDYATFCETFWRGSLIKWNIPPPPPVYPPTAVGTNNVKLVSDDVLTVERHGNSVSVNLKNEQPLTRPVTGYTFWLPAFSLELNKVGGSAHNIQTKTLDYYADASGYTYIFDTIGFNANAVFSSTGALKTGSTSNAVVVMHGTHTFFPPT